MPNVREVNGVQPRPAASAPEPIEWRRSPTYDRVLSGRAALTVGHRDAGPNGAVRRLQEALVACGVDVEVDGYYGAKTKFAVTEFQRTFSLQVDGIAGKETLSALVRLRPAIAEQIAENRRAAGLNVTGAQSQNPVTTPGSLPPPGSTPRPRTRDVSGLAPLPTVTTPTPTPTPTPTHTPTPTPTPTNTPTPTPTLTPSGTVDPTAGSELVAARGRLAVETARAEIGVRERGSTNRSERIDHYATVSRFPNPRDPNVRGRAWCGYFTGFALNGAGFTHAAHLQSIEKAEWFFMYRQYTKNTPSHNAGLDALRSEHEAQGSTRQFFMLPGSPAADDLRRHQGWFGIDAESYIADNTFSPDTLPLQPGDAIMFERTGGGKHIGLVESYDPATHVVTTIEGNAPNGVYRKTYDLDDYVPNGKRRGNGTTWIMGFGRAAAGDFGAPPA